MGSPLDGVVSLFTKNLIGYGDFEGVDRES